MKLKSVAITLLLFIFSFGQLSAQVFELQWNTFHGCLDDDSGNAIALDNSGNVYITGVSDASWGSPLNAHSGDDDIFVAKLDSSGNLIWNTFLGSASQDGGSDIILDNSGNIYITGSSWATWGSPINAYSGLIDAFVAKLDNSGTLVWNTFMGSGTQNDLGFGIELDSALKIHVTGSSYATWGSPINAYSGQNDAFVAKLDNSGTLEWNTFIGNQLWDFGFDLTLDASGNIFISGQSFSTWGTPVNAHNLNSKYDVFAACLDNSGNLVWNTFMGALGDDKCFRIKMSNSGNLYLVGWSPSSWGSPINVHSGLDDDFIAKLDSSGNRVWNTFLCPATGNLSGIALDSSENIYVGGTTEVSWGSPINPFSGGYDAYVAGLDSNGNLLWNTFLESTDYDLCKAIIVDNFNNVYVTGFSEATWGNPVNSYNGQNDILVARLSTDLPDPVPTITANGSGGPISITQSDTLKIKVTLNTNGLAVNVDYWLAYKGPSGWVHYNNSTKKWESGLGVTHQGPLMDLNNKKVFQSKLAPGNYTFYFGVDMDMNGKVTKSSLYKDEVQVTVTSN